MHILSIVPLLALVSADTLFFRPHKQKSLSVVCPDKTTECPTGNTCCKISSAEYGCCPLPNAVCCKDDKHCCPQDYTCDATTAACTKGKIFFPWVERIPKKKKESKANELLTNLKIVVCPDGQSQCSDGQTCCKLSSGQYGCCPLASAVCCSDGVHCCPSGTTCDVSAGTCSRDGVIMDWFDKRPAMKSSAQGAVYESNKLSANLKEVVCPDGQSQCHDGNTCCKLSSGHYGCCPLPNAVCCSDGKHCCPSGSKCDASKGKCTTNGVIMDWFDKRPAMKSSAQGAVYESNELPVKLKDVVCPGGQSQCPDGNTCCKLSSGQYGCCPIPNAVCCSDGQHCCPSGYTCDVSAGTCQKGGVIMDWFEKSPALKSQVKEILYRTNSQPANSQSVQCDATHTCPTGNTCCKTASGSWGCCPLPEAVCCSDNIHCCPQYTTCDVTVGKCDRGDVFVSNWVEKQPAKEKNVICPDGMSECPTGHTCCKTASGSWGCCPLPEAVCCSDNIHCCPQDTTCDVTGGKCDRGDVFVSNWVEKQPAKEKNVICPDGMSECPTGHTCCKTASGSWGCCPLPNAVCCSDLIHCCPQETICDVSSGSCNRGDVFVSNWVEKQPAKQKNVICPDGMSECPTGNTCCKTASGSWGCCPLPQAVCCKDKKHCCPQGYSCDTTTSQCIKGHTTLPWLDKVPAKSLDVNKKGVLDVICPDGETSCTTSQTCCELSSGKYGCCPEPNAVCCSDGKHCCPSGHTCNVSSGRCQSKDAVMDWLEKQPALRSVVQDVICPDGQHQCPSDQTCCKLSSGEYGCCPLPNAVCCSDGKHCCPSGHTCNVSSGRCQSKDAVMDWLEKQPALRSVVQDVICPDGQHQCSSDQTCCKLSNGEYGCCPLPNAVCCSDGKHCCPSGHTCNVSSGRCQSKDAVMDWLEKQPALRSVVQDVICPDGQHQCSSDQTCCKLSNGEYGCCPLPNAVCCSDGKHCCPSGHTCNVSSGRCQSKDAVMDWLEKQPALRSVVQDVICPDGQHQCSSDQTCCKLSNGEYGCCPLPNAVCCSDGKHCCPSGHTCNVSSGRCQSKDAVMDWLEKQPALRSVVQDVICPDGQHQCPSDQTCCKLSSGEYGCCPTPNAVCCSDGNHCCQAGKICNLTSGHHCHSKDVVMDWFETQSASRLVVQDNICPDGTHTCHSGQTCCKKSIGHYSCCPLQNAVCCSDGKHCCPAGKICNVTSGHHCHSKDVVMDWFETQSASRLVVQDNICPDGTHTCNSGQTCCKKSSGQYGCCPLQNAVCCSDGKHCCPAGRICNVTSGHHCHSKDVVMDWFETQSASRLVVQDNICPDGTHTCNSGQTCCKKSSGQYGCCPLQNAVCCSDGKHCCPAGKICNVTSGHHCHSKDVVMDWFETQSASRLVVQDNICPDGTHTCNSGQTCCKKSSGQYGCCPLQNAVCCSDGKHCCPAGKICNVTSGHHCHSKDVVMDWFETQSASRLVVQDNICPDGTHTCNSGQTCCKKSSGQYGCCPLQNAVCCSDGKHCCPAGKICNVTSGHHCHSKDVVMDWFETQSASRLVVQDNICPDGTHTCNSGQTCCKKSSGQYGCCPLQNAVCCSDGKHCCPAGKICNVTSGHHCHSKDVVMDWFETQSASRLVVQDNICPDGTHTCNSGQTCCKKSSGQYGCCPLQNAVCCSDGKHCCPAGKICNVTSGHHCHSKDVVMDWFETQSASRLVVQDNICPDGTHTCNSGQTCCKKSSGQYGCCPLQNAVCCSDGKHCCPAGKICNVTSGHHCHSKDVVMDWFETQSASRLVVQDNICPDGTHTCNSGQTCCKKSSGQYGCCPLQNAVCCSDGKHCCPAGKICNVTSGHHCHSKDVVMDWFETQSASRLVVQDNICPDGTHTCNSGQTCCKKSSGQYGCCPLQNAVCCSDGKHCCPAGKICNVTSGHHCHSKDVVMDWFETQSASRLVVQDNICPDGTHTCNSGQTCCKKSSGQYGCCPLQNAVCCSDGQHCCPSGQTCDMKEKKCTGNSIIMDWLEKQPARKVKVRDIVCNDNRSVCPDNHTCCKLASGEYGCCPAPNAVCCADMKHCCQENYICDGKQCVKKGLTTKAMVSIVRTSSVMCPDGTSECMDGQTCCLLTTGQYGCCSEQSAVCCSDHIHCCPSGYTCNLTIGGCVKEGVKTLTSSVSLMAVAAPLKPGIQLNDKTETSVDVDFVLCKDNVTNCPANNICCEKMNGGYKCCPYAKGVCCTNSDDCCPHGYVCDGEPEICRIPEKKAKIDYAQRFLQKILKPDIPN